MNEEQFLDFLKSLTAKTDVLSEGVDKLISAIKTNPEGVPQTIVDAANELQAHLQTVQSHVTDATATPTNPGEGSSTGSAPGEETV